MLETGQPAPGWCHPFFASAVGDARKATRAVEECRGPAGLPLAVAPTVKEVGWKRKMIWSLSNFLTIVFYFVRCYLATPWEPENHLFEEEHNLPNLNVLGSMLIFRGVVVSFVVCPFFEGLFCHGSVVSHCVGQLQTTAHQYYDAVAWQNSTRFWGVFEWWPRVLKALSMIFICMFGGCQNPVTVGFRTFRLAAARAAVSSPSETWWTCVHTQSFFDSLRSVGGASAGWEPYFDLCGVRKITTHYKMAPGPIGINGVLGPL